MAERVDFAIPPRADQGKCRHCKAEIVWVPGKKGMMPLDMGSAVLVTLASGELEKRAESHFAHCPKASLARKTAPKALCMVADCGKSIPRDRHFCPRCWALVPRSVRRLLNSYRDRYGLKSQHTRSVLRQACQLAKAGRAGGGRKAPGLFGSEEAAGEDPG